MKKLRQRELTIYGKATRAFVDYEDYSKDECILYYQILEKVVRQSEPISSNYLLSGLKTIVEEMGSLKQLFKMRFSAENDLSVSQLAKNLKLSKQGLLKMFDKGYKFIRAREDRYDISKRISMLSHAIEQLKQTRQKHGSEYVKNQMSIDTLNLKTHTYNCLKTAGIKTVEQFMTLKLRDIKSIKGVGEKTFNDIVKSQQELKRSLGGRIQDESKLRVEDLELGTRSENCIRLLGVQTIDEFLELTKFDILSIWHAGEKTWQEIYHKQQSLKLGNV